VIRDLHGNEPSVAGRELMQNAVDAVRARRMWEEQTGISRDDDMRPLEADVVVSVEHCGEDEYMLRVADRGIGMTPDTAASYYLCAGASLATCRGKTPDDVLPTKTPNSG
jgi:HSP90 family molecular chaperone